MTCFLNKNIEKLALHLSSWTRPVSPKLHGTFNFLTNFWRRCWGGNGVFCVLTSFYLLFQGSENYLEKNTTEEELLFYASAQESKKQKSKLLPYKRNNSCRNATL